MEVNKMHNPARKMRPKKNLNSYRGKMSSIKNGAMIDWESLLEKDFIKFLEFDPMVETYEWQPIEINYSYNNKERSYYPDFRVNTRSKKINLCEVKPLNKVNDEKNLIKFEVGKLFCKENDWILSVFSEDKIRQGFLIENLDFLRNYPEIRTKDSIISYLDVLLEEIGPCSIVELKSTAMQKLDEPEIYMNLFYMIYKQYIKADLINERLNLRTLIGKKGKVVSLFAIDSELPTYSDLRN
jgi:hypothetical protein